MSSSSATFMRASEVRTPSPRSGGPFSPNHPNIPRTNPQTPRRRKTMVSVRLQGITTTLPNNLSLASISRRLVSTLNLQYVPDDWQVHLVHRIFQGYDSIFCAGMGYGKSLIFEGLAVLGGKGKLVIVISSLKALERDQAEQATAKGIDALVINKDTTKTAGLWKHARANAAMVYMSPEMPLAPSFLKDHLVEVRFALREIFEPHMPDRTRWEAGSLIICSLCVAHETACPGFDLLDFS